MNDNENRKHQMSRRVHQFFSDRTGDFAAGSLGKQLITDLGAAITELDGLAAAEASSSGSARQGTITRAQARANLREDLEAINRTARTMDNVPGLNEKFRLPRGNNDQQLISAGRAYAADAPPLKAQFLANELPADFLEDLNADIAAMEEAIGEQSSGVGGRVAASAAIDDAIERSTVIIRKLDTIVRNKYAGSPATIAEWTSASHTERAPRRKKDNAAPSGSAPPASGSTPSSGSTSSGGSTPSSGSTPPATGS